MQALKDCARIVALTTVFSGAGMMAMVSAQDDDYPTIPGYEHTKVVFHSGLKVYPLKQVKPNVFEHTNEVDYPDAYKLKKIVKPVDGVGIG